MGSRRMQVERDFLWFGWGQESLQLLVKIVLTFVVAAKWGSGTHRFNVTMWGRLFESKQVPDLRTGHGCVRAQSIIDVG